MKIIIRHALDLTKINSIDVRTNRNHARKGAAAVAAALSLLVMMSGAAAQERANQDAVDTKVQGYETERSQAAADRVRATLEEAVFPTSKALAFVMATLPRVDGRRLPLSFSIVIPEGPDERIEITHTCLFGPVHCEPFFEACGAFGGEASPTGCTLPPPIDPPSPE